MITHRLLSLFVPLWMGMLLGISFLEAPVKFQAPSLTLPVALDVGRMVFGTFSKVEFLLMMITAFLAFRSGCERLCKWLLTPVWVLVLVQFFYLRPYLDDRVQIILNGGQPPDSPGHIFYIIFDFLKVSLLAAVAYRLTGQGESIQTKE